MISEDNAQKEIKLLTGEIKVLKGKLMLAALKGDRADAMVVANLIIAKHRTRLRLELGATFAEKLISKVTEGEY